MKGIICHHARHLDITEVQMRLRKGGLSDKKEISLNRFSVRCGKEGQVSGHKVTPRRMLRRGKEKASHDGEGEGFPRWAVQEHSALTEHIHKKK